MAIRIASAAIALLLLAGPAFADCEEDIREVEEAAVAARTGAPAGESGMAATQHQSETLAGEQETTGATGTTESTTAPASRHQEEAIEGEEASGDMASEATSLIEEAKELAAAGDEEGCTEKLTEAKSVLGME